MKVFLNAYKYETEAVIKLFFPIERFEFLPCDENSSDVPDSIVCACTDELYVSADISGKRTVKTAPLPENESEYELSLCRLLFVTLSEMTGITPEWGCLTGIRPVKKVNALIREGCDSDTVYERLRDKYLITRRKSDLAYLTAMHQQDALRTLDDKSYSLYISIPFCPSRCSYCSFVSHSITSRGAKELIPQYVDMLCRELSDLGEILRDSSMHCDTVYIGGGTPTAIGADDLYRIMSTAAKSIDLSHIREYTVEAGRPDTMTEDKLSAIKDFATRISINPQTLSDSVLRAIGRVHSSEQFYKAFALARKMGFDNINTDTIAGLPTDTYEGFRATIDGLIALAPEDITVHTLTVKRSAALFQGADRKALTADDVLSDMVNYAFDALTGAGYSPYYLYRQKNTIGNLENVGYSRDGCEGLYNIYIMEETQDILACGAGGSTKLTDRSTGKITRYFNYKYPYEYISRYDRMTGYKEKLKELGR
ncbi:MAG: coproporphyrinogen dehydrogenase HemZ [Oscillospiraceae bacterium]|nr:coproporphyrinogen dehydrogenase HemZ [Oscillospiraceae bacterium]